MGVRDLPLDGAAVVLTTDDGASFALGAWEPDPAHLCAAVQDEHGQRVLLTLLDDDAELSLLVLLLARARARVTSALAPAPPAGQS